jgi:hypothetical protein
MHGMAEDTPRKLWHPDGVNRRVEQRADLSPDAPLVSAIGRG